MIRYKLKCGGHPRKKALLGADGAIMAAATLTAAAMNTAATVSAAKNQANAVENSAKTQAAAIKAQTANNTQLQQENINFTRQQNKENRDQQQAIQTTLQMLAGQQNMNDRLDKSKVAVKYGGSKNAKAVNQRKLQSLSNHNRSLLNKTIKAYNKEDYEDVDYDLLVKAGLLSDDYATDDSLTDRIEARDGAQTPFYGGASAPFTVTDGGGVIPLNVDNNGYGLYEIYGNDHNHYHKTNSGKYKSGVGFKFNDGTVVEGEGNQNTNQGELFYVTPQDAMFISKHSINGFNPAKAVQQGMHPQEAFNIQQSIKTVKGISDDGNKTSYKRNTADDGWWHEFVEDTKDTGRDLIEALTTRKGISRGIREFGQGIPFLSGALDSFADYVEGDDSRNRRWGARRTEQVMSKYKTWNDYLNRTDKRKMKYGGRVKAPNGSYWQNYGGATYNAIGNILGAGVNVLGNYFAGNTLSKAYNNAGNILANAYDQMGGIDLSSISREDYAPGHAMAVVRSADTNVNPQLERLRRNATSEKREVNRNTLSSAARQQRLAGIDDRMYQRAGEVYASKLNEDEKIKQQNAANIQDVSEFNAKLDANANKEFANTRLSLMQYNNNINNAKIAGRAQSLADAATQSSAIRATAMQNSTSALGSALASIGQGFASAYDANRKQQTDFNNAMIGADTSTVINYLVRNAGNASSQDRKLAETYYNMFKDSTDSYQTSYAKMLANAYGFGATNNNAANDYIFPELIGTSHPFYRYSVIRK